MKSSIRRKVQMLFALDIYLYLSSVISSLLMIMIKKNSWRGLRAPELVDQT